MVSAWAADCGLTLGQVATEQKSNEITAIPKLLELLDIRGATVTIDAMGCQKQIAEQIIEQEGDYMLGLKGNQGTMHDEVKLLMDESVEHDFAHMQYDFHETVDGDHGRIEHRKVWCTHEVDWFKEKDQWRGRGPAYAVSLWWKVIAPSAKKQLANAVTLSAVSTAPVPNALLMPFAVTGELRTVCTGFSMSPSTRIDAAFAKVTPVKTCHC